MARTWKQLNAGGIKSWANTKAKMENNVNLAQNQTRPKIVHNDVKRQDNWR
ncbi:hypothetical protein [Pyrobaculum aerophilum]|uniref:hypothetical protein n=1 Tax=Pyrobaculum aerophilum TaxID=13773 RepID=UPI0015F25D9B|nr:hypothetical protein [Pyrobaculum aerophilum]